MPIGFMFYSHKNGDTRCSTGSYRYVAGSCRYFAGYCRYFAVSVLFVCVLLFIISFDGSHLSSNCHWVIRPHG